MKYLGQPQGSWVSNKTIGSASMYFGQP